MHPIVPGHALPLHDIASTRQIEALAMGGLAPHALMDRAGRAVARLALAVAPHAHNIWIACGPGNNGGDAMVAALHLLHMGKNPLLTLTADSNHLPSDAQNAFSQARQAGVHFLQAPPGSVDLCIDALLGIGARPPFAGVIEQAINSINAVGAPVLAVDLPSGLNANTGSCPGAMVQAHHTLSLLTLKPGLFTACGRDASGTVWLDSLSCEPWIDATPPVARLNPRPALRPRRHNSHKGLYGDVGVVGGAPGMVGAALLAATAALHGGAGRVYVELPGSLGLQTGLPDLMIRPIAGLDCEHLTVVCGCGGSAEIRHALPQLLSGYSRLVIDAEALNSIASDMSLQRLLKQRRARQWQTVLTPHPLEAARMLDLSTSEIQSDRLEAARQLAERFGCTVALKGSGTVIASPGDETLINPTGNALLAIAGTGDVLAGLIGAGLANGLSAHAATCAAVYQHGELADQWPAGAALTAHALANSATTT